VEAVSRRDDTDTSPARSSRRACVGTRKDQSMGVLIASERSSIFDDIGWPHPVATEHRGEAYRVLRRSLGTRADGWRHFLGGVMSRGSAVHDELGRHFRSCVQCRAANPEAKRLKDPKRRTVPQETLDAMCPIGRSVYKSYVRWLAEPD
jgi:hypothetical protein